MEDYNYEEVKKYVNCKIAEIKKYGVIKIIEIIKVVRIIEIVEIVGLTWHRYLDITSSSPSLSFLSIKKEPLSKGS